MDNEVFNGTDLLAKISEILNDNRGKITFSIKIEVEGKHLCTEVSSKDLPLSKNCDNCNGWGWYVQDDTFYEVKCKVCHGTGRI